MKNTGTEYTIPANEKLHALSPKRIELSKELFSFVSESLNRLHKKDLSERFWKLIAEEYTRSVIIRYDRFRGSPIRNSPAFLPQFTGEPANFKTRMRGRLVNVRNYIRSSGERKQLFDILQSHDQFLVGFSADSLIADETGAVPLPACAFKPAVVGDRKKRGRLNKMAADEPDLLKQNILRQMPGFLVEHFSSIYDGIDLFEPEKKAFHIRGKFNFSYRQFVMAKYAEFGSGMIWYQNGAMVGECKYKYGGYLVRSVADEHRTWGWKMNGVDRPWKAYDLEQFGEKYEQAEKSGRDDLLITFPKLWGAEDHYLGMTEKLLHTLDKKQYRSIRIRPYPSWKSGSGAAAFQKISDPRVTVSAFEESMAEEIANSRIVLHVDVPATSFLESVSVDHPSVGILMNDNPTDIVKPFYQDFLDRRVLHAQIESVAEHLNSATIDDWWAEVKNTEIYADYKKKFTGSTFSVNSSKATK
jgi:hypothetical protein